MKYPVTVALATFLLGAASLEAKIITITSYGTITSTSATSPINGSSGIYPVSGPQIGAAITFSTTFDTDVPTATGGAARASDPTGSVTVDSVSYSFLNGLTVGAIPNVIQMGSGTYQTVAQFGISATLLNSPPLQNTPLGPTGNPLFYLTDIDASRTIITSSSLDNLPLGTPDFTSQSFTFSVLNGAFYDTFMSNNMVTTFSLAGDVPEPASWVMMDLPR